MSENDAKRKRPANIAIDPYREWLGIQVRPGETPDHYTLLGIARFEDNPKVIESAWDRQMSHVKKFKLRPESQSVLNALTRAYNSLMDAQKKAAYDAQLRAKSAEKVATSTTAADPFAFISAQAAESRPLSRQPIRRRNNQSWLIGGVTVAVFAGLAVAAVIVVNANSSKNRSDSTVPGDKVAQADLAEKSGLPKTPAATTADLPPKPTPSAEPVVAAETTPAPEREPSAGEPVPPTVTEGPSATEPAPALTEPSPTSPAQPVATAPVASGTKLPVPPEADVQKALGEIRTVLGDIYAAASEEYRSGKGKFEKREQLLQLLLDAAKSERDATKRWTLLQQALVTAANAGKVQIGLEVITSLGEYELTTAAIEQKQVHLVQTALGLKEVGLVDKKIMFVTFGPTALAAAFDTNDYANVEKIGRLGETLLSGEKAVANYLRNERSGTKVLEDDNPTANAWKSLKDYLKRAKELAPAYQATEEARAILDKTPDDPEARRVLGEFYCYAKQDTAVGLPLLARSNSPNAKFALAALEMPAEAAALVALADEAKAAAATAPRNAKDFTLRCAKFFYEAAIAANVEGLLRVKARAFVDAPENQKLLPLVITGPALLAPAIPVTPISPTGPATPSNPKVVAKRSINLLNSFDKTTSCVKGKAEIVRSADGKGKPINVLKIEPAEHALILLPIERSDEKKNILGRYKLTVQFQFDSGNDDFDIRFPIGEEVGLLFLRASHGKFCSMALLDGYQYNSTKNPSYVSNYPALTNGTPHVLQLIVAESEGNAEIACTLDSQKMFEWKGNTNRIGRPKEVALNLKTLNGKRTIIFGNFQSGVTIFSAELEP